MASDLRGYTEQETLNKVLNTDNDSIQVDIVDATGVTITATDASVYVDDADWTNDTSSHTLVGGLYQSSPQSITNGDTGPLQVNAAGNLIIDVVNGGVLEGLVDGIETLLGTIDGDTSTIAGDTTSVDGKITACNTGAVVLAAGSAAIGKLATNTGVDIGDVDVTSIIPGTGATSLGKAEDAAHTTGDTGVMSLAVRNDDVAALSGTDGDYSPLQVNAAGALYTSDASGEAGSILVTGTGDVTTTVTANTVFVAIQFVTDTVFDSTNATGLVSVTDQLYPSSEFTSTSIDADAGAVTDSVTFPQGMTIFGRWSGFKLASGSVVAYIGHI